MILKVEQEQSTNFDLLCRVTKYVALITYSLPLIYGFAVDFLDFAPSALAIPYLFSLWTTSILVCCIFFFKPSLKDPQQGTYLKRVTLILVAFFLYSPIGESLYLAFNHLPFSRIFEAVALIQLGGLERTCWMDESTCWHMLALSTSWQKIHSCGQLALLIVVVTSVHDWIRNNNLTKLSSSLTPLLLVGVFGGVGVFYKLPFLLFFLIILIGVFTRAIL